MPRLSFRQDLLQRLAEPREAQGYLEAALADGDPRLFLEALKDVAEARGGITNLARNAKLHRTGLYRFFSRRGNPTYKNLNKVMEALGYRFCLAPLKRRVYAK